MWCNYKSLTYLVPYPAECQAPALTCMHTHSHGHAVRCHNTQVGIRAALSRGTRAAQYAPKGVRVNSVLPGAIVTEAIETMAARRGVTMDEQNAKLAEFHAMKRVGQADEVRAQPVLFIVSSIACHRQAAYAVLACCFQVRAVVCYCRKLASGVVEVLLIMQ